MKLFIYLSFAFLLVSCTMTKKVHSSGYHLEWKKNQKSVNVESKPNDFKMSENMSKTIVNGSLIQAELKKDSLAENKMDTEKIINVVITEPAKEQPLLSESAKKAPKVNQSSKSNSSDAVPDPKVNRLIAASIGSLILGATSVVIFRSSGSPVPFFLMIGFMLSAGIFGLLALIRAKRSGTSYPNLYLAWIGMILGFLAFIFITLVVIALILTFGG